MAMGGMVSGGLAQLAYAKKKPEDQQAQQPPQQQAQPQQATEPSLEDVMGLRRPGNTTGVAAPATGMVTPTSSDMSAAPTAGTQAAQSSPNAAAGWNAPTQPQANPWAQAMGQAPNRGPSGWVNLQEYMGLNQLGGQRMADKVGAAVRARGDKASAAMSKDYAATRERIDSAKEGESPDISLDASILDPVTSDLQNLGSFGGQATLLRGEYGQNAPYTTGQSAFDAFL